MLLIQVKKHKKQSRDSRRQTNSQKHTTQNEIKKKSHIKRDRQGKQTNAVSNRLHSVYDAQLQVNLHINAND